MPIEEINITEKPTKWESFLFIVFLFTPLIVILLVTFALVNADQIDRMKPMTQLWVVMVPCTFYSIWWIRWRIKRIGL